MYADMAFTEEERIQDEKNSDHVKLSSYFADYTNLDIHKIMLNDNVRTGAYYRAIVGQKDYFKDKIVMDVGCGTGILSLFCAKAGAKKVYAVDGSNICDLARDVVKANNLENVIEVVHSAVEEVILPDNIKVDVIVSEWMGFYLLHEGMLDSVIRARDLFLKEDGKMFPEHAFMYLAPCSMPSMYEQWDDFYGVTLTPFAKKLVSNGNKRPEIEIVSKEALIGPEVDVASFNLNTATCADLDRISIKKVIPATRDGHYQGLCIWWKCIFPAVQEGSPPVVLSTSPGGPATHWKQCVLVLPFGVQVEEDQPIAFELTMYRRKEDMRNYKIEYDMVDPDKVVHPTPCNCHKTKCILAKAFLAQLENNDATGIEEDDITDITEEHSTETSYGSS